MRYGCLGRNWTSYIVSGRLVVETYGVFRCPDEHAPEPSELFLSVIWATFICAILSLNFTPLLARCIKKLERASEVSSGSARGFLGVWSVG